MVFNMESKYERYTYETIDRIANSLVICNSASEASRDLGIDVSGLIKHIKKYRVLKESSGRNKCALKQTCKKRNEACTKCRFITLYNQKKACASCKINCNEVCKDYTKVPTCKRISKWPYVCNGCIKKERCNLCKFIYDPSDVWKVVLDNRSKPRKGSHATEEEFVRLSKLLSPLIKEKHQSLPQIFQTHKVEIRWSYVSILSFIDQGLIPGIKNIDLTKRVRYPKNYKKKTNVPSNAAFISRRTYDDFVVFISENPFLEVVEMDTVLSTRESNVCLLTLLFRKSNFMLAFLLPRKTSQEVKKVFQVMRRNLKEEVFTAAFRVILTDNGSEFANPIDIEFDEQGIKTTSLFYCDPGKSGQKGKIEKNHVELRKIFPKGTDFSIYTQEDINMALRHINSEPRAILNGSCPGKIAQVFIDPEAMTLIDHKTINPDEVLVHPSLFKK